MTATLDTLALAPPDPLWAPRFHSPIYGASTDGPSVAAFAHRLMIATKGMRAGVALDFTDWQRWALSFVLQRNMAGWFQYRQAVLGLPRKTAKSLKGSAIALHYLVGKPDLGREIYSIAGDRQQAKLVFGEARWQVLNNPSMEKRLKVYRDAIEHPPTGSVYRVLSHDGKLAQGFNPFLTIADEFHVYPGTPADPTTSELWEAMAQAGGARPESLLLAITTAGNNYETPLGRIYRYGMRVANGQEFDPTFGIAWWAAPDGCDYRDEANWHIANPNLALGLADMEEMRSAARKTPEMVFRRYRLNQFIHGGGLTWMDMGAWDRQADPDWVPTPGEEIVMAFDGSVTDDATALVGMTVGARPTVFVLGMWARPEQAEDDWQVPRGEVEQAIEDAFDLFNVRSFQCDTSYWLAEFNRWQEKYGKRRVLDFTMSNARMVPAAQEFYSGVCDGKVWHNGDSRLTEHVGNAVTHETPRGIAIKKDAKNSKRKIDLAVAACMANDARLRIPRRSGVTAWGF